MEHELRMFRTTDGLEVTVRPVSQYLLQKVGAAVEKRLRDAGALPDAPTYTVTTVAGNTETHEHTAESVTTEDEKLAWAHYQAGQDLLERERRAAQVKVLLLYGTSLGPVPAEWQGQMAALGIDLPTDANDLLYEYLQIEVLKTPEDIIQCTQAILRLSAAGVPKENLEAAEASFRRAMEGTAAAAVPAAGG